MVEKHAPEERTAAPRAPEQEAPRQEAGEAEAPRREAEEPEASERTAPGRAWRSEPGPIDENATYRWVLGLAYFAGVMMLLVGGFQIVQGVAAVAKDEFYVTTRHYLYSFDVTAWGWVHIVLGAAIAAAGFGVFAGRLWGRVIGIALAVVSVVDQFLYLPHYPIWSVLMIGLQVAVIWALCVRGRAEVERERAS
ncbi:DUF7144 family membrane protein [Actinomadura gamaensis]|uniref:DUF7144 domain-containing protein n=1 Tax=Actinomadura gamaensis TaxID=1763541 RepID=A0ABV9U160_9ACTN